MGLLLRCAILGMMGLALVLTMSRSVGAQEPDPYEEADRKRADKLFDEAKSLMEQGKFAEACERIEQCLMVDPTPKTRFILADCYEEMRNFSDAIAEFEQAAELARQAGKWDLAREARERAKGLRERLTTLTVLMRAGDVGIPGLKVTVDGWELHRDGWIKSEVLVDAGEHTVEVTAPGRAASQRSVTVPSAPVLTQVAVEPGAALPLAVEKQPTTHVTTVVAQKAEPPIRGVEIFGVLWAVAGGCAGLGGLLLPILGKPNDLASGLLVGGGVASLLGGILLVRYSKPSSASTAALSQSPRLAVAPWVLPHAGGAWLSASF